ncbi:hypothetical protein QAD02_013973 [Eretmocerus hayati]|uniref:Uncharacterized protein n=1 Tax=Eretmocerus hayati TaxID=131215 RepID=A0ACC2P433_9HYME|nr:hypothetical protein QAD02_013973 [Eretmocerus hayati]
MCNWSIDRHKAPRVYKTDHEKEMEKREKQERERKPLSSTHQMTDFLTIKSASDQVLASNAAEPKTNRKCQPSLFLRPVLNPKPPKRSWPCFSKKTGKIYCFYCKLFGEISTHFTDGGFGDWKNAVDRMNRHEKSSHHVDAHNIFTSRSLGSRTVDKMLNVQILREKDYWIMLLESIVRILKYCAVRNLPLREETEILGESNNGNFLGMIEFQAEIDPFMKAHLLRYGAQGHGNVSYLSHTIYEELVEIIGEKMLDCIFENVREVGFWSISTDSTIDAGHIDQFCVALRYLESHVPVKRFLAYLPNFGHKAGDMFTAVENLLVQRGKLRMRDCRGQSYDNAASLSGRLNRLQALFKKKSRTALWIPCIGHSLNLVGTATMNACSDSKEFFDFLEELYVFLLATERHKLLTKNLEMIASIMESRPLAPKKDIKRLSELSNSSDEAKSLLKILCRLETGIYLNLPQRIDAVSKKVQSYDSDLNTSLKLRITRLSASMGQNRLNNLSVKNIEHDLLDKIVLSAIIHDFAARKARRVKLE